MENNKQKEGGNVRPPVAVILGHVDHGKTSILDYIRKTKVVEREAGSITQHIGAYQAEHNGKVITFLDTPGHEAFSAIRSRGAKVADVAILVVAADEGVKPQTKESIKALLESKTPFVVAINKIDKEGSNPMKVKQELAENNVLVEGYGGQVPVAEVSAISGKGIDQLLELVLLLAEMEELEGDISAPASGVIIEAHIDKHKGIIATILVADGILRIGDWLVAGGAIAHIKGLEDFIGKRIKEVHPSQPAVVLGWTSIPPLGERFEVVGTKGEAEKRAELAKSGQKLFSKETQNELVANLIIKADVQSSLEAIDKALQTIKSEKADYKVVGFGVGNISDADIKEAAAKGASIVGFNVSIDRSVKQMAEREGIKVRTSDVIYRLVETVRDIMTDLLPSEIKRTLLGELKVLAEFGMQGKSQVIGGRVIKGSAIRGSTIDVIRDGEMICAGKLGQLQQNKQDVAEVKEGNECGIRFEPADASCDKKIEAGDILRFYKEEKIKQSL